MGHLGGGTWITDICSLFFLVVGELYLLAPAAAVNCFTSRMKCGFPAALAEISRSHWRRAAQPQQQIGSEEASFVVFLWELWQRECGFSCAMGKGHLSWFYEGRKEKGMMREMCRIEFLSESVTTLLKIIISKDTLVWPSSLGASALWQ